MPLQNIFQPCFVEVGLLEHLLDTGLVLGPPNTGSNGDDVFGAENFRWHAFIINALGLAHGLWGMGQMMFTKYLIVVDDDVDVHNTSEVLFRLCANTDPQRDCIFTKGPADVLDHATSAIGIGTKLGMDATRKLPGEGFQRPWPLLIKIDAAVRAKGEKIFNLPRT